MKADALIPELGSTRQALAGSSPNSGVVLLSSIWTTTLIEKDFVVSGFRAAAQCLARRLHLDAEELLLQMLDPGNAGRGRAFNIIGATKDRFHSMAADAVAGLSFSSSHNLSVPGAAAIFYAI